MHLKENSLIKRFHADERFTDVSELVIETRTLNWFKEMYIKHAFDAMGEKFKSLYDAQVISLKALKLKYKENYGS